MTNINNITYDNLNNKTAKYPIFTMILALGILLVYPFISPYFVFIPFLILIYRAIRYNLLIKCIDLVFFLPFMELFKTPSGDSLIVYYILMIDIIQLVKQKEYVVNSILFTLCLIVFYFIFRVGTKYTTLLFIGGGLLFLYLVFCCKNAIKDVKILYSFIAGVIISSLYALILINIFSIESLFEIDFYESERFNGFLSDPNYYSTLLILALVGLLCLRNCNCITTLLFYILFAFIVYLGVLTISKSFFITLLFIIVYQLICIFIDGKVLKGSTLTVLLCVCVYLIFYGKISFFDDVIQRISDAATVDELTTGRTFLWGEYLAYINGNPTIFLFGNNLDCELLSLGTHNIFIEMWYSVGVVGLILMLLFLILLLNNVNHNIIKQNKLPIRFLPLISIALLYFFLQGFTQILFYVSIFISYMCYAICLNSLEN